MPASVAHIRQSLLKLLKNTYFLGFVVFLVLAIVGFGLFFKTQSEKQSLEQSHRELQVLQESTQAELTKLQNEDQFQRNEALQEEIENINETFESALARYEEILKLKDEGVRTQALDAEFAEIITLLADRNYASASTQLTELDKAVEAEQAKLAAAAAAPAPANVPVINTAPDAGGYRRQSVETELGTFVVDVIAADLGSTRVVVETASGGDCGNECPVDALASYVAKAGGYAGINGPYFCPAEYPSCAGKTNSFDTLLMNKNKVYFNSDNNVYSSVPAVIFSGSSARFVGRSQEWGRDTGPDSVIASQPMLLSGGNITFNGDGDPKKGSRGGRSFIGTRDSTLYIGVVRNATVAEVGYVLKTMGVQNALNLDGGGSVAMYLNGRYVAGPGRNTPFGIVLVRK
jgi:hypothetical protein